MASANQDLCQICRLQKFKYTCPKCNIIYCSVNCYRDKIHSKCSEEFYKSCIMECLDKNTSNTSENMNKIAEILKRVNAEDDDFEVPNLDSDDESEEEVDLADRVYGIDLDNSDKLWEALTDEERKDFKDVIESGEIFNILPEFKSWWDISVPKIVDLEVEAESEKKAIPEIVKNIPKFSSICKKTPSPNLQYNLWNILCTYSYVNRVYRGEFSTDYFAAAAELINLSCVLKYDTKFESVEDAVNSVKNEAATTPGNNFSGEKLKSITHLLHTDGTQLMSKNSFKLAALSEIKRLFREAKKSMRNASIEEDRDQKLHLLRMQCETLTLQKMHKLIKKIDYFLAYVMESSESE